MPSLSSLLRTVVALGGLFATVHSFAPSLGRATSTTTTLLHQSTTTESFIDTELRGAAMRLHTRSQAPKEGQAAEEDDDDEQRPNYVTTHADYLRFLVDSQHVYQALEDIVNSDDRLAVFRSTGLERTAALTTDIAYMMEEYHLERPAVGKAGLDYAKHLRQITSVPEFVCHFYNFYFAHTAGGRMIGTCVFVCLAAVVEKDVAYDCFFFGTLPSDHYFFLWFYLSTPPTDHRQANERITTRQENTGILQMGG